MKAHPQIVADLITQYADHGVGAEIGVFQGDTSAHILNTTNTKMLYMIDQYKRDFDTTRFLYTTKGSPESDCANVSKRFTKHYPDRHKLIIKSSEEASKELDDLLDFVFIDANHTYESVIQDMNLWIPKVKQGGLIMGHDWWSKFPGVIIAVTEYTDLHPFLLPENPEPKIKLPSRTRYQPAPFSGETRVYKSWPEGHVWWGLKSES